MKIAFVWDWPPAQHQVIGWQDGLAKALVELQRRGHQVSVFMPSEASDYTIYHPYFPIHVVRTVKYSIAELKPDVVLMWGDATRPNAEPVHSLNIPMALCFAGGNMFGPTIGLFNHVFVESQYYYQRYLAEDNTINVSIAFGANTELFHPINKQPKVFDTIFPATFANWKRHGIYAAATKGLKSLAVGHIQPDGIDAESWQDTMSSGTVILPHVTADVLRYLYAASRVCVVTSSSAGGSQRTVLEAMSMNIPLIITDSDKFDYCWGHGAYEAEPTPESVRGFINAILDGEHEASTRDYVVANWSERNYADSLEKGLSSICA